MQQSINKSIVLIKLIDI